MISLPLFCVTRTESKLYTSLGLEKGQLLAKLKTIDQSQLGDDSQKKNVNQEIFKNISLDAKKATIPQLEKKAVMVTK